MGESSSSEWKSNHSQKGMDGRNGKGPWEALSPWKTKIVGLLEEFLKSG